jgi:transposase
MSDAEVESNFANAQELPAAPPLSYQPANARLQRRMRLQRLITIIVIFGAAMVAWREAPHAYAYAKLRYWQRQCMNFEGSPDTAVCERRTPGSQPMAIASGYIDATSARLASLYQVTHRIFLPADIAPVDTVAVPSCVVRFLQLSGNQIFQGPSGVLFSHRLVSPCGNDRLVIVARENWLDLGDAFANSFFADVYEIAGWNGCRCLTVHGAAGGNARGQPLPQPRHVYAGQPDPNDLSHFTIGYEWPDGTQGIIDGHLQDDDTVTFAVRPGPGDIASVRKSLETNPAPWQ